MTSTASNSQPNGDLKIVSVTPNMGDGRVAVNSNIVITFNQPILAGSGKIIVRDSDYRIVFEESIDSPRIKIVGATLTLDPLNDLSSYADFLLFITDNAVRTASNFEFKTTETFRFQTDLSHIPVQVTGTALNDFLHGGTQNDTLIGSDGRDTLVGYGGDDVLIGGDGSNGSLDDFLYGREGNDSLYGNSGDDYLDGGAGDDLLEGGAGDDQLRDSDGDNTLRGGDGNDWLDSSSIAGKLGSWLEGGAGNDILIAKRAAHLDGGDGDDRINFSLETPQANTTEIFGGQGNDQITVSYFVIPTAAIVASGGPGTDTFKLSRVSDYTPGQKQAHASLIINDFSPGENGDQLDLSNLLQNFNKTNNNPFAQGGYLRLLQDGADVLLQELQVTPPTSAYWDIVRLKNVRLDQLTSSNFVGGINPDGSLNGLKLQGTSAADVLVGSLMNDEIQGHSGRDSISGNAGNDVLIGGDETAIDDSDSIDGGSGNDLLKGGAGNDVLHGNDGDDTLEGGSGDDYLYADSGNDHLDGGSGNDSLDGGFGDCELFGGLGNDSIRSSSSKGSLIDGGEGNDSIWSGSGSDTIDGGNGNDEIVIRTSSGQSDNRIIAKGGNGDDKFVIDVFYFQNLGPKLDLLIDGGSGKDLVTISKIGFKSLEMVNFSSADGDSLDLRGIFATNFVGNPFGDLGFLRAEQQGQDTVISIDPDGASGQQYLIKPLITLRNVALSSLNGNHFAGGWNPNGSSSGVTLTGTEGNDTLTGTDLNDQVSGGEGLDKLIGGSGDDFLSGANGNDTLLGQAGNDTLTGGDGDDTLEDYLGNNLLKGDAGNDRLLSNGAGSTLSGGAGDDYLFTSPGKDSLDGGDGNDIFEFNISYQSGQPNYQDQTTIIFGGSGDDKLIYTSGNPKSKIEATGGPGVDTYQASWRGVLGQLKITDFTPGIGGDVLDVGTMLGTYYSGANPFARGGILELTQVGADVQLSILSSDSGQFNPFILLKGIKLESLVKENFTRGINPRGTDDGLKLTGTSSPDQINGDFLNDTIYGGDGNDTLDGALGDDSLDGGLGNDRLDGGAGNDILYGGEGADQLIGDLGNDTMHGGAGNDSLGNNSTGASGNYALYGDDGDDYLHVNSSGTHTLDGGLGNDTLTFSNANVTASGGDGDDVINIGTIIVGGWSLQTLVDVNGGEGNDTISFYGGDSKSSVIATGGNGSDKFMVRVPNSLSQFTITDFKTGIGGDLLDLEFAITSAGSGLNNPFGTVGVLRLQQRGNDTVIQIDIDGVKGSNGFQDLVILQGIQTSSLVAANFMGGYSPDGSNTGATIDGKDQPDNLVGGRFNDTLNGYGGDDTIEGGYGDDQLSGGDGNDYLSDNAGRNILSGGDGNDYIKTLKNTDSRVDGGAGNDTIEILASSGFFKGGEGNDVFVVSNSGTYGVNAVSVNILGDAGEDRIQFESTYNSSQVNLQVTGGDGRDIYVPGRLSEGSVFTVLDFDVAENGDQISVADLFRYSPYSITASGNPFTSGYLTLVQDGNDTLLKFDYDGSAGGDYQAKTVLTLKSVEASKLNAKHFVQYISPNGGDLGSDLLGDSMSNEITGGWFKDKLFGFAGNDTLLGASGDDELDGGIGDDLLIGGSGNDFIKGGQGSDTALYYFNFGNYKLTKTEAGLTVYANNKTEGLDTLTGIEYLRFEDININLAIRQQAASISAKDLKSLIEIYVAFFNRTPDADGLSYWIDQVKAGQSLNQISESFYNIGASQQFSRLTGFTTTMSNTDFVNTFYKNVLGRTSGADADGLNYWKNKLTTGESTRGSLAQDILNAAHSFKGDLNFGYVADLLDNKYQVGKTVAVDWGISYPTDAFQRGVEISKAVTATDINVALSLVGVANIDMSFF